MFRDDRDAEMYAALKDVVKAARRVSEAAEPSVRVEEPEFWQEMTSLRAALRALAALKGLEEKGQR